MLLLKKNAVFFPYGVMIPLNSEYSQTYFDLSYHTCWKSVIQFVPDFNLNAPLKGGGGNTNQPSISFMNVQCIM